MNCRKCGLLIDNDSKFCSYCGANIVDNSNSSGYDDPFKDLRIGNTHGDQYNYQQYYSNNNSDSSNNNKYEDYLNPSKKKVNFNLSLLGLLLGFISIFVSIFVKVGSLGLFVAVLALILTIVGFKNTSRKIAIISLVLTIFNFMLNVLITVFFFIASFTVTFSDGREISIKDYFTDAFFCGYNENRVFGEWNFNDNLFLNLDEDGTYKFYLSLDDDENYYYGNFYLESGYELNIDETIYGDDEYYYYQFNTSSNGMNFNGKVYDKGLSLFEEAKVIKLDKKTKNTLIIAAGKVEYEFERK